MFEEIDAAFHVKGKLVLFAWGDTIYNPRNAEVSSALKCHEGVHGQRQKAHPGGVEGWWRRYIEDPQFRIDEELPAHRAEYKASIQHVRDRNERYRALAFIAEKLASPLYGRLLTPSAARRLILGGTP